MLTTSPKIDPARLARITELESGAHSAPTAEDGIAACAMEAAAYIAGEEWTDHPACVCPVIAAFMRCWNDSLPDAERSPLLLPLVPLTVGTRGSAALALKRRFMAADWLVRTFTPAWLRLAGLTSHADDLADLAEITSLDDLKAAKTTIAAAGATARATARAAAGDAAWAAVRDAAWAAAEAAAWDAAWAAAGAAAGAAARATAGAAARATAGATLEPTKITLQASAADLVRRMCALTDADLVA